MLARVLGLPAREAREGPRISEAARLQVQDVDLDRGVLRLEKNETNDPRAWALSPGVAPALRAWLALRGNPAPSAPLFVNEDGDRFSVEHAAERFRAHLQLAGIDRPELSRTPTSASRSAPTTRARPSSPSPSRTTAARPGLPTGPGTGALSGSRGIAGRPGRLQHWVLASWLPCRGDPRARGRGKATGNGTEEGGGRATRQNFKQNQ
ncbi:MULTISPECIES: tyrosine-type recombinase/integrase [Sorangium]|uniref:tyrosine-type recombinase/integrase n=1 Tax=Sorangium TaxID=39643 RepID=UPI003D9C53A4